MKRKVLSQSSWRGPQRRYPWVRFRRQSAGRIATDPGLQLDLRLFLLIASRVSAGGHSVFEPGEMSDLLPKVNETTGEVGTYGQRQLDKRLAAMVYAEVLAPSSNTRCAVLPMALLDPQERERVYCPEHRHDWAWSVSGWVGIDRTGQVYGIDRATATNGLRTIA